MDMWNGRLCKVCLSLGRPILPASPPRQNWIPVYLASLGEQQLSATGALSALPWLAAATVGMVSGSVADRCGRASLLSTLRFTNRGRAAH